MKSVTGAHGAARAEGITCGIAVPPNEVFEFADLAGKNNAFATIDYSNEPPWVFAGSQVTLEEIGLGDARPVQREAKRVSTAAMGCPNCGGPISVDTVRWTGPSTADCPYCSANLKPVNGKQ